MALEGVSNIWVKTKSRGWLACGHNQNGCLAVDYVSSGDDSTKYLDWFHPTRLDSLPEIINIKTDTNATFFLDVEGNLYSCGTGATRLGQGRSTDDMYAPNGPITKIATGVAQFDIGTNHGAYVTFGNELYAWGSGTSYKLGTGTSTSQYRPVKVTDGVKWVSCTNDATQIIKLDGTVWGVGKQARGLACTNSGSASTTTTSKTWTQLQGLPSKAVKLYSSELRIHIVCEDGSIWGLGHGGYNMLGMDTKTTNFYNPIEVEFPQYDKIYGDKIFPSDILLIGVDDDEYKNAVSASGLDVKYYKLGGCGQYDATDYGNADYYSQLVFKSSGVPFTNVTGAYSTPSCSFIISNGELWGCGGQTTAGKKAASYDYELGQAYQVGSKTPVLLNNITDAIQLCNQDPPKEGEAEGEGTTQIRGSLRILPSVQEVDYPKYQTHVIYKEATANGGAYVRGYGENNYGQLLKTGNNDYSCVNESVNCHMRDGIPLRPWGASSSTKVEREVAMLSCGYISSYCLLDNGDLYACGNNFYGQLGLKDRSIGFDSSSKDTHWHLVRRNVKWVSAFGYQVIVVGTDNVIYKAGINYNGTPGNGEWAKLASNVDRAWATGELEHYYTTIKGRLFKGTVSGTVEIDTSAISYISGSNLYRYHITHCYNKARRPYFTTNAGIYVSDGSRLSSGGNHKIVDSTFERSDVQNYQGITIDQRVQVTVNRTGDSCTKGGNYWCQCGTSNTTDDRRFESDFCYEDFPKGVVHTYCTAATVFMLQYGMHNEDISDSIIYQGVDNPEDMGNKWAKEGTNTKCTPEAYLTIISTYPQGTHTHSLLPDYYPNLPAPPDEDRGDALPPTDAYKDLPAEIQTVRNFSDLQSSVGVLGKIEHPERDQSTCGINYIDEYNGEYEVGFTGQFYPGCHFNFIGFNPNEIGVPTMLSQGNYHSVILFDNGEVWGSGCNFDGALGTRVSPYYCSQHNSGGAKYVKVWDNAKFVYCFGKYTAIVERNGNVYVFGMQGGYRYGEGDIMGDKNKAHLVHNDGYMVHGNSKWLTIVTNKGFADRVFLETGEVTPYKFSDGSIATGIVKLLVTGDEDGASGYGGLAVDSTKRGYTVSNEILYPLKYSEFDDTYTEDKWNEFVRDEIDEIYCSKCEDVRIIGAAWRDFIYGDTSNGTFGTGEHYYDVKKWTNTEDLPDWLYATNAYGDKGAFWQLGTWGGDYIEGVGRNCNRQVDNDDSASYSLWLVKTDHSASLLPDAYNKNTYLPTPETESDYDLQSSIGITYSSDYDLDSVINIAPRNDLSSTITITDTVVSSLPSTLVVPAEGGRDLPSELSITRYTELPSQMFAFVNPDNVLEGQITINTNTMEVEYDVPPNDRNDLSGNIEIIHTGSSEIRSSINIMQHTSMEGIYDIPLSDFSSIDSNIEVIYSGYPYLHSQLEIAPNAYMDAQYGTEGYEERNLVGEITVEQNTRSELESSLTVYSEYTAEEDGRIGYNIKSSINVQANGFSDMYGFISAKMYNQMQGNVVFEELGESDLPVDVWIPYIDSLDAEIIVPPTNKMYGKTDIVGVGESEIEGSLSLPYIDTLDSTIEININNKMWGLVEIELPPMYEETLYAIGDSYINSTEHEFNFGEAPSLSFGQNDGTNRTLMAFLTEDIPDNHEIYSVYLRVFYGRDLVKKPAIYAVDGDWNELGVTWDNAPAIGEFVTDEYQSYNDFNGTYIEFDVTKFIAKEFAAGADIVDFYLVDLAENKDGYDYIYSRETPRYAPRLLLKHYDPTVQNFGRTTLNSTVTVHEVDELWGRITTIQYNTIDSEIAVNHWNQLKGTITTRIQGLLDGEIAVSRPNLYGSITARQSDYEEIGGSIDIRIPAENDLRSKIGVNRWWLESELTVSIYTDYDMDSTIGIYGYGNNAISGTIYARRKDMIFGNITVSRPEMRGTIRVRNSDGNNLLGTIKVRDYSYKNLRSRIAIPWHTYRQFRGKISITRPSLRGSIFVPWHNDLDSTITVPYIGEDSLDSSIAISRPTMNGTIIAHNVNELNSKISIRQEGEYNIDSTLSISRPTMNGTIIAHQVSDMDGSIGVRVEGLYDMMGYIQVNGTANLRGTIDVWHFDTMEGTIRVISGNLGSTISVRQKAVEELRGTIAVRITTHSTIDSSIEVFNTWYRLPSQLTVGAGTAEMDGEYGVIGSMDYDIPSMVWIPKFEYLDSEIRIKYDNRMQGTAEFLYTSDLPAVIGVEREGWDTILCTIDIPSKSELEGILDIVSFGAYAFIM